MKVLIDLDDEKTLEAACLTFFEHTYKLDGAPQAYWRACVRTMLSDLGEEVQ